MGLYELYSVVICGISSAAEYVESYDATVSTLVEGGILVTCLDEMLKYTTLYIKSQKQLFLDIWFGK